MAVAKKKKRRQSWDNILFDVIINLVLLFCVIIVVYPIYFVVVASFSDPTYVNNGTLLLYPKGFTLLGYERVFQDERIITGYANTILYTVCGTALGTMVVMMAGYALSRSDLPGRGIIMKLFVFTMYFGGGTIPFYLTVKSLGLLDTRTAMIVLGCCSVYNMIVVSSFMQSNIAAELLDSATIDGCGDGGFFFKIVLPLSKAVIAVMVLYIAVGYWNSYFNAMIFLFDSNKYPLQLNLREILLMAQNAATNSSDSTLDPRVQQQLAVMGMVIKYAVIVVSTAPIICVYPFVQKYFVQGVMIGSVKG